MHPAVIARQAELIDEVAARDPNAVAIVESALIFETKYGGEGGWRRRFDRLIFVKASEELRIARFVARAAGGKTLSEEERRALEAEARRRMARPGRRRNEKAAKCDYVLTNDGSIEQLQAQVDALWPVLKDAAQAPAEADSHIFRKPRRPGMTTITMCGEVSADYRRFRCFCDEISSCSACGFAACRVLFRDDASGVDRRAGSVAGLAAPGRPRGRH